jgi:serine protease inhibitor
MNNPVHSLRRVAAALLVLAVAGCGGGLIKRGPGISNAGFVTVARGTAARVPAADPRLLGAADTAFGLDLLRAWCRQQPASNIVFSPESLAAGLGLAYLGARGSTATAMARVLHLPAASGLAVQADMRARWRALGGLNRPGVTLASSNRVWSDPSLPPLRGYLDAVATAYDAGLSQVPLDTDPAKATQIINAAVGRDTRGHIPSLFPPDTLSSSSWVLTSALYMDAAWATAFQTSQTWSGPFSPAVNGAAKGAASTTTAQFMHGSGYQYATAGGWTGVRLPYRGGQLAMTALLPPAGAAGCPLPSAAGLGRLTAGLGGSPGDARVALPKVNLTTHQRMSGLLTGLGMGIAFGPKADFGALSPAAQAISVVEHAATLKVGEQGTVGSAATGVGIASSAAPLGRFVDFDRPYLMLVTDTASGEPLFLARVVNPAAS